MDELSVGNYLLAKRNFPHLFVYDVPSSKQDRIKNPLPDDPISCFKKVPDFDIDLHPFYLVKTKKAIMVANVKEL